LVPGPGGNSLAGLAVNPLGERTALYHT
jgi:hypothetical protein